MRRRSCSSRSSRSCSSRPATSTSTAPTRTAGRARLGNSRVRPAGWWMMGWAIVAADVIVMAALAQIAAKYNVPARRVGRGGQLQRRADHRRGHLDRVDDLDLLEGHRAQRADAAGPAGLRDRRARGVRRRRPGEGLRRERRRARAARARGLVQPVLDRLGRAHRRRPARRVHLLWLGLRRGSQRGDRVQREGPGKAAVISTVLLLVIYPRRLGRGPGLGRHRPAQQELRRRPQRPGDAGLRLAVGQAPDPRRPDLRVGVDADDDPAGPRARRCRWPGGARSRRSSGASTRAIRRRTTRRSSWVACRWSGPCSSWA